jgi:hypothetical protein
VADIETSVAITAQTDDLQSGMEEAADAVGAATGAMKAQFADLGTAAQQAQANIGAATAQIGSTVSALQSKVASLAGSVGGATTQTGNSAGPGDQSPGISVRQQTGSAGSSGSASQMSAWRAELQSQLAAERSFYGDSKAEELAFWQDKQALTEAGSKEQLAVENNIYQLEKQLAMQNERDALASLSADEKVTDATYARKKAAIEDEAALGKISSSEETAQLKDLLDTEWALEQDYYQKKMAAAENDARTQQKLTEEEEIAYQKYLTDKDKLDTQAVQNSEKQWQSLLQPIQRALDTSITGIIMGTTTVQKALSNLAQSIIAEFVNSAVKGVFGELGNLLGGSLFGGASSSGGDQDFWGGAGAAGEGIVGGGIFSSLFKGIGSLFAFEHGGIVPSAQGGWMVPSTSLAMLHANEMVLPADISQGLQGMIAGGGNGSANGGNVMFNVSAIDGQSVAKFFQSNGSLLVAAINRAMRNGSALRSA